MTSRRLLVEHLNMLLAVEKFKDYCPNGLQLEGREEIRRIITGVSLNQELIDIAISEQADGIIVHHGLLWNNCQTTLTGIKYQRLAKLIKNDINLLAYHLPLDNHNELGNNAQLAKLLNIEVSGQCGEQDLLWYGNLNQALLLSELAEQFEVRTGHQPNFFGEEHKDIKRVAWCTGGAVSMFEEAIELGVECFITGEIKEHVMHLAKESGVAYIAGGHYVTERYGIMALTNHLNIKGYNAEFVELYNPL